MTTLISLEVDPSPGESSDETLLLTDILVVVLGRSGGSVWEKKSEM